MNPFTVDLFRVNPAVQRRGGAPSPERLWRVGGFGPPREWLKGMRKAPRGPRNPVRDDSCYPKVAVSDCAFCAFFSWFAGLSRFASFVCPPGDSGGGRVVENGCTGLRDNSEREGESYAIGELPGGLFPLNLSTVLGYMRCNHFLCGGPVCASFDLARCLFAVC